MQWWTGAGADGEGGRGSGESVGGGGSGESKGGLVEVQ